MYDVVCAGGAAVDDYYVVARLPKDDEKVPATYMGKVLGGPTCNTARALLQLGAKVLFVHAVGNDEDSAFVQQRLASIGLSTRTLRPKGYQTGHTLVMASQEGEKAILTFGKADMAEVERALSALSPEPTKVAFATLGPAAATYLEKYTVPIVVNLEEQVLRFAPEAYTWAKEHAHTMVIDRHGFARLFGRAETPEALMRIMVREAPSSENVIVTMGAQGSMAYCRSLGEAIACPAFRANVVDPTAAGDIFNAAFIFGFYLSVTGLAEALRFANAVASASCEELGTDLTPRAIERARAWLGGR